MTGSGVAFNRYSGPSWDALPQSLRQNGFGDLVRWWLLNADDWTDMKRRASLSPDDDGSDASAS
jgi:hypothetical protein